MGSSVKGLSPHGAFFHVPTNTPLLHRVPPSQALLSRAHRSFFTGPSITRRSPFLYRAPPPKALPSRAHRSFFTGPSIMRLSSVHHAPFARPSCAFRPSIMRRSPVHRAPFAMPSALLPRALRRPPLSARARVSAYHVGDPVLVAAEDADDLASVQVDHAHGEVVRCERGQVAFAVQRERRDRGPDRVVVEHRAGVKVPHLRGVGGGAGVVNEREWARFMNASGRAGAGWSGKASGRGVGGRAGRGEHGL